MLSDPKKRQTYDRHGLKGMQERGHDGMSGDNLFSHLFGGGLFGGFGSPFGGQHRRRHKGEDTVHHLKVTLEDLYNGKTSKLQLSKNVICSSCNGKGGRSENFEQCPGCNGRGFKITFHQVAPGIGQQTQVECTNCFGECVIIKEKDRCTTCKGKKVSIYSQSKKPHSCKGIFDSMLLSFISEISVSTYRTQKGYLRVISLKFSVY